MNIDKPTIELPPDNSDCKVPADAFMDAAVRTLLPRLKEIADPVGLRTDEAVVDLMRVMFFDVRIGFLSESQAVKLLETLPEIVDELKRLEYGDFEEVSGKIYSVYLEIAQALEARQNRSEVKGCLDQNDR